MPAFAPIEFRESAFDWRRCYIAGIVNVTPDSFSDGGLLAEPEVAVGYAEALVREGADLIDVGGESTRPGARPVPADQEIARVVPVIVALSTGLRVPISIDTTKAAVAEAAIAAGAEVVNDISGGLFDPDIVRVTAAAGAAYICGHVRGTTLEAIHAAEADPPGFDDVVAELGDRLSSLPAALRRRTVVDPCLGFGKRAEQNLELTKRAGELADGLHCPVMIGPSRKRFLGELTGRARHERDDATVGAALAAVAAGAHLVRVHDVARLAPALRVFEAAGGGRAQ